MAESNVPFRHGMSASSPCPRLGSTLHFVQYEMRSLTFRRLISGTDFTHVIVRRRTAMSRMRLDAIPFYDEYDPAGVFNTGKKLDSVRAGKIGVFECLPEFLDIHRVLLDQRLESRSHESC